MSENNKITTKLGRVSIVPRGEYAPEAVYQRLDLVRYGGEGYLALHELTGVTPDDGADWMLVAGKGDPGTGIRGVELTSGSHAAGTMDTYTITFENGDTSLFQVYNGADGTGAGDMRAAVYDPDNRGTDIFAYVDKAVSGVELSDYYTKEQTDTRIDAAASPAFTQAKERSNVASGEKLPVLFGKIQKWFADLKPVAFSGAYSDLSGAPEALKNPKALHFTGAVTGDYDGSEAKTVEIPEAYSLPPASASGRGGVKTGYAANGKNYPVELSAEQMYVNVPWIDTDATQAEHGLMSTADKRKLDEMSAGWTKLWENASPESVFAAQTVSVDDLSAYNMIAVRFRTSTSNTNNSVMQMLYYPEKETFTWQCGFLAVSYDAKPVYRCRFITLNKSNSTITIDAGRTGTSANDNTILIPEYILGVKV